MAVAGMLTSSIFNLLKHQPTQTSSNGKFQQIKQEFQQLGSDLSFGNLSQAQSDFSALQQYLPSSLQNSAAISAPGSQSINPLHAAVNQLGQDLQSGNLSAAQSDFAAVQKDVQQSGPQQGAAGAHHHHHHHSSGSDSSQSYSQQTALSTLFGQLGSSLQSGNLSAAQQVYTTLQQDFQQFALGGSSIAGPSASSPLPIADLNISA
jgi:hypothetical protein